METNIFIRRTENGEKIATNFTGFWDAFDWLRKKIGKNILTPPDIKAYDIVENQTVIFTNGERVNAA